MASSCVVDDIEDLLKQDSKDLKNLNTDFEDANRYANKSFILPYGLKKSKNLNDTELQAEIEQIKNSNDCNIPGIASIYVKTWGCTHNSSDSEYMAGQLASYGYKIVGNMNKIIHFHKNIYLYLMI
jgi:threonylcarbamoyladenosine tRNA methylthiotransferase CDKAL1